MATESIPKAELKESRKAGEPEPVSIRAADGFTIKGFFWRHPGWMPAVLQADHDTEPGASGFNVHHKTRNRPAH